MFQHPAENGATHLKMEHLHMNRFTTLSLALTLIAGLSAACASQPASAPATALTVEAKEFQFTPAALEVVAGQPVKLTLQNSGTLVHEFSITEIPLDGAPVAMENMPAHDMGSRGDQPALHVAAALGASATVQFTPKTPGTFTFFCAVAGHKEAGMTGTLTVTAP
jgi:uncharacterized cupredoxin-like copper-binding protein